MRSGGHSPNPGFSSIAKPGVLIDLSGLDGISVSDDKETVSIGPGQRWGNVYDALDPYGVSVIGARIPNVGVGGLLLGGKSGVPCMKRGWASLKHFLPGGYFHFSAKYGLAADNVKSFEVRPIDF